MAPVAVIRLKFVLAGFPSLRQLGFRATNREESPSTREELYPTSRTALSAASPTVCSCGALCSESPSDV
ncbi:hypothetical protein PDJAM_G00071840 [Pangasius djambal]|uniref:Uncharacterized protein n=1 Tax=Pangasius djambal TaxID=1691987 RepID=A0ACC5Z0Y1_9TELE|nr:hypothetical protein [Pangasius djambal]